MSGMNENNEKNAAVEPRIVRLGFTKHGPIIFTSHLDLQRTMMRILARADLPLWYTQGFNPHAKLVFALPLPLGCASECELMDIRLEGDMPCEEIKSRISDQFPEGIEVIDVYEMQRKVKEIKWLRISGVFEYDERDAAQMAEKLNEFYAAESIVITKKTKRGMGESDIRPAIKEISFESSGRDVILSAVISAQEPTLNPELIADALRQLAPEYAPDFAKFRRLEIFDENMEIFR